MTPNAAVPSIFDLQSLSALKKGAKDSDPQALKAAAKQFEALFLQMVLKSMRDATPHDGMFDSEQTRLYESLLDQQMGQAMAARGGMGLAAVIEKQLLRSTQNVDPTADDPLGALLLMPKGKSFDINQKVQGLPLDAVRPPAGLKLDNVPTVPAVPGISGTNTPSGAQREVPPSSGAKEFVSRVWSQATEASQSTGIPAHFMVAQAALETGWGKAELRLADGSPSHNLFGIKAGSNWSGPVVEASTTEYINGVAQRQTERFRAYGSYAEAFRDYANLLTASPRYAGVVGTQDPATFARGLQRGGYATDPMYAAKLERIIGGSTMRQALTG